MGPSFAPPLHLYGDTISGDSRGPMDFIQEQWNASTCLAASSPADLENVRSDLAAASGTVNERNAPVDRLRSENS